MIQRTKYFWRQAHQAVETGSETNAHEVFHWPPNVANMGAHTGFLDADLRPQVGSIAEPPCISSSCSCAHPSGHGLDLSGVRCSQRCQVVLECVDVLGCCLEKLRQIKAD